MSNSNIESRRNPYVVDVRNLSSCKSFSGKSDSVEGQGSVILC